MAATCFTGLQRVGFSHTGLHVGSPVLKVTVLFVLFIYLFSKQHENLGNVSPYKCLLEKAGVVSKIRCTFRSLAQADGKLVAVPSAWCPGGSPLL